MTLPLHRLLSAGACLLAALWAQPGSASEPDLEPHPLAEVAATAAAAAGNAGQETGGPGTAAPVPGKNTDSRLLRSLSERAAQAASQSLPAAGASDDPAAAHDAGLTGPVLYGCPRALIGALLAEAAETGDAVSALAIEREILGLCRERQEIVTGIVTLERALGDLLKATPRGPAASPASAHASSVTESVPIVKESTPVRVVSLPTVSSDDGEAAEQRPSSPPAPSYAWFSIIGTAGDLRAGVSDGARVWFVREGDRLPGATAIERIRPTPPGVWVEGDGEAALPYRPRPAGAIAMDPAAAGDGS